MNFSFTSNASIDLLSIQRTCRYRSNGGRDDADDGGATGQLDRQGRALLPPHYQQGKGTDSFQSSSPEFLSRKSIFSLFLVRNSTILLFEFLLVRLL